MIWYFLIYLIESLSSWVDFLNQRIKVPRRSWNPSRSVFTHFSQPDGFRAERLGDAMRVLGMNPTEEEDGHGRDFRGRLGWQIGWPLEFESRKLASPCPMCLFAFCAFLFRSAIRSASTWQILGAPVHDERTFHHFIKDSGFGTGSMFGEVSRRVFVKVCDFAAVSAIFGFQWCSPFFFKKNITNWATRHHAGWIDKAFRESSGQSDDDSTGLNFMCPCLY